MPQLFGVAGRPNGWRAAKMAHRKRSLVLLCCLQDVGVSVWAKNTSGPQTRAQMGVERAYALLPIWEW